jgi:hypothetical protein
MASRRSSGELRGDNVKSVMPAAPNETTFVLPVGSIKVASHFFIEFLDFVMPMNCSRCIYYKW